MNARRVIDRVTRLKPNALSDEDYIDFINEVEKELAYNVYMLDAVNLVTQTTLDLELLAPEPYENVYFDYLCAKVDYFNGDIDAFSLTSQQYNITMAGLKAYCIRKGITPSIELQRTNYF